MTLQGVDIAWARPTVAQIKAVGARFVARYFSTDDTKNLHASEVAAYSAAGLGTVVVWETTTGRARAGMTAGQADARAAEAQRKAVGLPPDMPIHFAVDEDTSWSSVVPYFAGAVSVLGQARVGVYGGYAVIEGAAAAGYRYLWQTTAWSQGRWSAHATIRQTGGTALGGNADWDTAMADDYGQYPRPTTPQPEDIVTPADIKAVAAEVVSELLNGQLDDPRTSDNSKTTLRGMWWYTGADAAQANTAVKQLLTKPAGALTDAQVGQIATALAGNTAFVSSLAHAIGADLAARLQS